METYTPQKVGDRVLGETLSISIGTAIPLEILLSTDTANGYTHLYLNLRTLYRNFHGSFDKNNLPALSKYVDLFVEELVNMRSIIIESVHGKLQPVLYLANCKSLAALMPRAKIKSPVTILQKNYESLERMTLIKTLEKLGKDAVQIFDVAIKGNNTTALIVTHLPLDLLSHHSFRKLLLLESHTGALKTKTEWITKITKNDQYRNIPFNILTIQILGDNSTQLASLGIKMTNQLLMLADTYHWSASTTLEKMRFDIRKMSDKTLASILLEMSQVKLK